MHGTLKPIKRKTHKKKRKIGFALGGGGVHTAFTAGVLSELFETKGFTDKYEPIAFSGTSGGAVNAFLTVYALNNPKTENVTDILNDYWNCIGEMNPLIAQYNAGRAFLNPLNIKNLYIPRHPNLPTASIEQAQVQYGAQIPRILKETIENHAPDWKTIKKGKIELLTNAVGYDEKTGEPYHKIFNKTTTSPDAVAAGGALKWMGGHPVKGKLLFDGAYWANPCTNDIIKSGIDTLIGISVQKKSEKQEKPDHQRETRNNHDEPGHELMLEGIHRHFEHVAQENPEIDVDMISLDPPDHWNQTSKVNTDPGFIEDLKEKRGRAKARKWLKKNNIPTNPTHTEHTTEEYLQTATL